MGSRQEDITVGNGNVRHKIVELERKLAQALVERDDLARDVEALCMESTANTTFSSSSVLRERIFSTEKELSRAKFELINTVSERDSLKEDLKEVRDAKRVADHSFREQTARLQALEREVAFYRQQAAQAISQRDSTAWECEQLKQRSIEAETQAREAQGRAEGAEAERAVAERRVAEAESKSARLSLEAEQAKIIPSLRADIERWKKRESDALRDRDALKQRVQSVELELNQRIEKQALVERQWAEAQGELSEVTAQKVDALLRLSQAEAGRARADAEVQRLSSVLSTAQAQLHQATQEKVEALMKVADFKAEEASVSSLKSTPRSSPSKALMDRWKWLGGSGGGGDASTREESVPSSSPRSGLGKSPPL